MDGCDRSGQRRDPDRHAGTHHGGERAVDAHGRLRLQLRSRYVDEVRVAGDEWDRSFTLTSLNVEYAPAAWEDVSLRGGIDNLFDADNESSLAADPGRFLHAGVRYDF
nr:TonB-dependent receptor [Thioalkalivibrio sp. ALE19]